MEQYIDKAALIADISGAQICVSGIRSGKTLLKDYTTRFREALLNIVKKAPPADVERVRHASWISMGKTDAGSAILMCSCCRRERKGIHRSAYCRDCGAKMDLPSYSLEDQVAIDGFEK
jgi:hypothetical protein